MIVGITGHRVLGNYSKDNPVYKETFNQLEQSFKSLAATKVLTGMAIGSDTVACEVCLKLKIPYVSCIPFRGQELFWSKETQTYYHNLLEQAETIEICSPGGYASWKMQARNQYIVDNCSHLVAVLRCSTKSGGTFNCVSYAKSKKRIISIIDPDSFKIGEIKSNESI